jgi:hypothetical protein
LATCCHRSEDVVFVCDVPLLGARQMADEAGSLVQGTTKNVVYQACDLLGAPSGFCPLGPRRRQPQASPGLTGTSGIQLQLNVDTLIDALATVAE